MNQKIKPEDIDRSHRIGNTKKTKKLKILVADPLRWISVTESLIAKKIKMLGKAKELHGFVNTWSQDNKIMYFDKNITKVNAFYN